jgi:hypothetical protein
MLESMQAMPWQTALAVFVGTLPILSVIVWNLLKVDRIEKKLDAVISELANIRERLATLEERDRWTHPVTHP